MRRWALPLLLLAVAVATRLAWLGSAGLLSEEARYAEIAREMVASGDWTTPRLSGVLYFEKPPLLAWLGAAGLELGTPAEWTLRLVPALTSLAACAALMALARRIGGARLAVGAGLAFLTMPLPWVFARTFSTDGPFSDALTVALALVAIEAIEGKARLARLAAAGLAVAFASLVRSPIVALAIYLPAACIAGFGGGLAGAARRIALPAIVGIALAAPWFIAIASREPTFLDEFFLRHHFGRLGADEDDKALHREPLWFYVPVYLWGQGAAALAGAVAFGSLLRVWKVGFRSGAGRGAVLATGIPLWILLLFSLLSGKRVPYVLPAFPWLALALAMAFSRATGDPRFSRILAWCLAPAGLLVSAGLVFSLGFVRVDPFPLSIAAAAIVGAGLLVATAGAAFLLARGRAERAGLIGAAALACAYAAAASQLSPLEPAGALAVTVGGSPRAIRADALAIPRLAREIGALAKPGDLVAHHGRYRHALDFYTGRLGTLFASPGELAFGLGAAGSDPNIRGRFRKERDFAVALAGEARILALADLTDLFETIPAADPNKGSLGKAPNDKTPIYVLRAIGRYGVVSNRGQ